MYKIIYNEKDNSYRIYSTNWRIQKISDLFPNENVPPEFLQKHHNDDINYLFVRMYWENTTTCLHFIAQFDTIVEANIFLQDILIPLTIAYKLTEQERCIR